MSEEQAVYEVSVDAEKKKREVWLADRRKGIGGSDVAAILGLSKWDSPVDVWMDKTKRSAPKKITPAMEWGIELEKPVALKYAKVTGRKVRNHNDILRKEGTPLLANIDRWVHDEGKLPYVNGEVRTDTILECKTANQFAAGEWGEQWTDDIPEYYLTQCMHYLGITGCQYCDVAVLLGGSDFRIYRIESDPELIQQMNDYCIKWWNDYVVTDTAPPARTEEEAKALFPISKGIKKAATDDICKDILSYNEIKSQIKELEEKLKTHKDSICAYFGEADTLVDSGGNKLVTWKTTKPKMKTDYKMVLDLATKDIGSAKVQQWSKAATKEVPGYRLFLTK